MTKKPLDLSQLALDRTTTDKPNLLTKRRRWLTRYALPAAILFGFLALLGSAAGTRLLPRPDVQVVPVIVKRSVVQQAGTTLFQAAGWIEPRPTAISVAALAPGVIEALLVVEGQHVTKDEPIARLITIDAELAVKQAKATLAIREGELARAEAERNGARVRRENPVHLQVQLADAQSVYAQAKTEFAKLPFLIQAAEANVKFKKLSLDGKRSVKSAIAGRVIERAESEYAGANAGLQELRLRQPNLKREVDVMQFKIDALQKQLTLLIEETRQLEEATAKVQSSTALRDEAKLLLQQAELKLFRNVVRATISGRVLRLVASPGTRVMGLNANAGQNSSTVIEMYDPTRLQVRADVRLEDVPLVTRGQPVEIETASSMGVIRGRVLQATSTANIQKNTLEVKVELIDPPATVSPEMLVTATFLAPEIAQTTDEPTETERMFVPDQLVQTNSDGSFVWIVDANTLAQHRSITLGQRSPDGLIEVKEGISVTDKLIASGTDGLRIGRPVRVTGEDRVIGVK